MAECTFAPKTTPIPNYLAQQISEAYASSVIEERLAEIRAASARASHSAAALTADEDGVIEQMISSLTGGGSGAGYGSSSEGAGASQSAMETSDAALVRSQRLREAMERELIQLQDQWSAQQEARHSPAAGVAATS
jgi:hypothetical protein